MYMEQPTAKNLGAAPDPGLLLKAAPDPGLLFKDASKMLQDGSKTLEDGSKTFIWIQDGFKTSNPAPGRSRALAQDAL